MKQISRKGRELATNVCVIVGLIVSGGGFFWLVSESSHVLHGDGLSRLGFAFAVLCSMASLVFFASATIALVGAWRGWAPQTSAHFARMIFVFSGVFYLFFGTPPFSPASLLVMSLAVIAGRLAQFFASRIPARGDISVLAPAFRQFPWF